MLNIFKANYNMTLDMKLSWMISNKVWKFFRTTFPLKTLSNCHWMGSTYFIKKYIPNTCKLCYEQVNCVGYMPNICYLDNRNCLQPRFLNQENLNQNLDGSFWVGGGRRIISPCLKLDRIMLGTSNLVRKCTHICSFRKYTIYHQSPPNFADVSIFLQKISIFWHKQCLYLKQ